MYEAMMIAATGLQNQQRRIDTIANNVANANTTAFKASRLDFKDALYTAGIVPALPRTPAPEGNQQKGHGVMLAGIAKDFSTGVFQRTDRDLDLAIEGEGFFAVEGADGDIFYTRNGVFYIDDDRYLTNAEGFYVLDINDQRIQFPPYTDVINIDTQGRISFTDSMLQAQHVLGVHTFTNITGLLSVGAGSYTETEASGDRIPAADADVRQGVIEGSNVNIAEEMTRLIRTQRAFQLSSRALTTADEMEAIANNMRR